MTGFAELDATVARLRANKAELLLVLDRPEIPLHTNGSERADSRAKRNGLSEADLHVFAKLREQGLERGEEAEALSRGQAVREHDPLQLGVAQGVNVEVPRQVAA